MIEELSIVARARMQLNNGAGPRPPRRHHRGLRQVIARMISKLGGQMISIGRRLECHAVSLLSDTDGLRPAKAQIK